MENACLKEVRVQSWEEKTEPLVSVAMIAYNVEKYIEEAIESVLMQKTDFLVELVIGEDCSTDNTRAIVVKYQNKYPDVIRVLLPEKNQGLTPNSVVTQNACKGKYIALLDGDDFWTDEIKLQKQVHFLETHNEYSACAHQSSIIKGTIDNRVRDFGSNQDAEFGIEETITHRKFHTSSLLYRRKYWELSGGIPSNISSNERAIYPMLAIYGKIKYFSDNMCVYRLAPTGLNSRITSRELESDLNMLPWLKSLSNNFPVSKFRSFLHLCMFSYPNKVPFSLLIKHFFLFAFFSFSYFPKNLGDVKYGLFELSRKL
jgi:glycosyltransferase involved in cell wall biosynthesis